MSVNLNPDQLLTFARVAGEGSLSGAAKALRLTQPAVSNQMRRLAAAVGEPLFVRHRLGVTLTPAGGELLPHALAVARALEGADGAVSRLRGLEAGTVGVAASTTIASYLLPRVLAGYRRAHPGLVVEQFVGNTREAVGRLEAGKADVALVEGPVDGTPPGVEGRVFARDEVVLVVPPGHPLAARESVDPGELEGLEVVWREQGSGTREVARRALSGVRLEGVLELVGSEAVKRAVAEGLGVAFLSRLVVESEVRAGLLFATSVASEAMTRPFTLLTPAEELLSRAARMFLEVLDAAPGAARSRRGGVVGHPPTRKQDATALGGPLPGPLPRLP